jgi:hypothetical protein
MAQVFRAQDHDGNACLTPAQLADRYGFLRWLYGCACMMRKTAR